jgi:hypothetical protein
MFGQKRLPLLNVKGVGVHKDAVHIENHGGGKK